MGRPRSPDFAHVVIDMENLPERLERPEACAYLDRKHSLDITPGALAHHDHSGKGPTMAYRFGRATYTPKDLDRWAQSLLTPARRA